MVDRLHFPLKSIMCAPVSCLDSMYVNLLVMYIELSMYAIIYVLTHCAMLPFEVLCLDYLLKYCETC
jgi:hypothetical protein